MAAQRDKGCGQKRQEIRSGQTLPFSVYPFGFEGKQRAGTRVFENAAATRLLLNIIFTFCDARYGTRLPMLLPPPMTDSRRKVRALELMRSGSHHAGTRSL